MKITISDRSVEFLRDLISGDSQITEYKSGPQLVRFFNQLGLDDMYGQGFPSRWMYVQQKLDEINGTEIMAQCIVRYFNPINFVGKNTLLEDLVEQFNEYLEFDDLRIIIDGRKIRILDTSSRLVESSSAKEIDNQYINEQIAKCEDKINRNDFEGAITNSRSLVESVFLYVVNKYNNKYKYDGDLVKLYKEVQTILKLSPSLYQNENIKRLLGGLASIVNSIAALRNEYGDAHGKIKKPQLKKHHALLIVNSAKSLAEFTIESEKNIK